MLGKETEIDKKQDVHTHTYQKTLCKMDENLVSKQSKEAQENIKKLNDIFKEKNREDVISEAYHKAKADGSNSELVKAVEDLLGKPKAETPNVEDWSRDVESTAKASKGKTEIDKNRSIKNAEKIDDGTGSHIKNIVS